jgi:hypothetical protein
LENISVAFRVIQGGAILSHLSAIHEVSRISFSFSISP